MSVYDFNCRRSDTAKLYNGNMRKMAVDLPPDNKEKCDSQESEKVQKLRKSELFDKMIEQFFDSRLDSDKLLIAALLYMLIKEGADIKLIIALEYILM